MWCCGAAYCRVADVPTLVFDAEETTLLIVHEGRRQPVVRVRVRVRVKARGTGMLVDAARLVRVRVTGLGLGLGYREARLLVDTVSCPPGWVSA